MPAKPSVLFVCLGNICRSPSAEGIFRSLLSQEGLHETVTVDSAGTGDWHVGAAPDPRAQDAAKRRGVDLSTLRARQVTKQDFNHFDYILAMDHSNLNNLKRMAAPNVHDRLYLFMSFADNHPEQEVPDPYYGGDEGFDRVLNMIEDASFGLLRTLRQAHAI